MMQIYIPKIEHAIASIDSELSKSKNGGARKKATKVAFKSTGKNVTFMKDGKAVTRVVYVNQRGTKSVKYNNEMILLSKLKISK